IAVLAIIIINAWIGKRVGFIKIVFSLFSFIITLLITTWISPKINGLLKNNETFYQKTYQKVEKTLSLETKENSDQDEMINDLPLPKSIRENLIENKKKQEANIKSYIVFQVTGIVINAIAFILTYVVVFVGLWIIGAAINIISKLPIIHQINKWAGFIVGGMQGLFIVWLLLLLLTVFGGSELSQSAFKQIEESKFLSFIYNKNFILHIVLNAVKLF
ncbi:MAG TPA: CvpA family protein, partial [Mobilitalea sp.]|nr:CvpA family protein [Mobilitalea sp.]